nr:hypothetical protein [Prolixibacteraceae bacterium]
MAAYPLLPIVLLVVAAYGITRLFARWHIIALQTHRKVWNWLLLTTFLVSGGLGLFSVVKINYQLDVPGYDRLLSWHVSFGIAMALISLIHLFHHLKYYFSPRTPARPTEIPPPEESDPSERKRIAGFLLLLGGVSIINQVVFIREFMSVLEGNEMVLGLVMAAWFLLTGWGAWHGRKTTGGSSDRAKVLKALIFIAFFPVLSIVLLYGLKRMLFPPGIVAGLDASTTGILLLLFPVCFLSGYLFTLLSTLLSREKNRIGTAYAYESIGSLMGGLLFAFLLGRFFTSIQVFSLTTGIVLLAGGWIIPGAGKRKVIVYSLAGL